MPNLQESDHGLAASSGVKFPASWIALVVFVKARMMIPTTKKTISPRIAWRNEPVAPTMIVKIS